MNTNEAIKQMYTREYIYIYIYIWLENMLVEKMKN